MTAAGGHLWTPADLKAWRELAALAVNALAEAPKDPLTSRLARKSAAIGQTAFPTRDPVQQHGLNFLRKSIGAVLADGQGFERLQPALGVALPILWPEGFDAPADAPPAMWWNRE